MLNSGDNSRGYVNEKVETLAYFLFRGHRSPSLTCPFVRLSPVASFLTGHHPHPLFLTHTTGSQGWIPSARGGPEALVPGVDLQGGGRSGALYPRARRCDLGMEHDAMAAQVVRGTSHDLSWRGVRGTGRGGMAEAQGMAVQHELSCDPDPK